MKRKIVGIITCLVLIMASSVTAFADTKTVSAIEYMEDGSYIETVIEENSPGIMLFASAKTKSGSKTAKHKNSSGTTLWEVKVTGVFSYNGSSSKCTSSKADASAPHASWSIRDKDESKSGSTARGEATAVKKVNGIVTNTMTKNVSLTCSRNGTLS